MRANEKGFCFFIFCLWMMNGLAFSLMSFNAQAVVNATTEVSCAADQEVVNGACAARCGPNQTRNASGVCVASTSATATSVEPIPAYTTWVSHPTLLRTSQFMGKDGSTCSADYETCIGTARTPSGAVFTAKCFVPKNNTNCPKDSDIASKCVRLSDQAAAVALRETARAAGVQTFTEAATPAACTVTTVACTANGSNDGRPEGCRCSAAAVAFPGSETTCVRTYHQCTLNKGEYQARMGQASTQCQFKSNGEMKDEAKCREFCSVQGNYKTAPCKKAGVLATVLFNQEGCNPLDRLNVFTRGNGEVDMFCTPHNCAQNKRWRQSANNGEGACVSPSCSGATPNWNPRTAQCQAEVAPPICARRCVNFPEGQEGTGWGLDTTTCYCHCTERVVRGTNGKLNCVDESSVGPQICTDPSLINDADSSTCRRRCDAGKIFTAIIPSATEGGTAEVNCQDCPSGTILDTRIDVNHCRPAPVTTSVAP